MVDILTLYVGQGALTGVRVGNEGIIVDAHMPETDHVTPEEIQQSLSIYFRDIVVRGLILTGFDADHAHLGGGGMDTLQFHARLDYVPEVFQGY